MSYEYRKATYFCDHCKIPGHTIQRCWKINGNPYGNNNGSSGNNNNNYITDKGKRVVDAVHYDKNNYDYHNDDNNVEKIPITPAQYNHYMEMLSKQ